MKTYLTVAALALTALASVGVQALGIDQREANRQARIQQGVMRGQLTPREAMRLDAASAISVTPKCAPAPTA